MRIDLEREESVGIEAAFKGPEFKVLVAFMWLVTGELFTAILFSESGVCADAVTGSRSE